MNFTGWNISVKIFEIPGENNKQLSENYFSF